jgi:hypothetical protein
MRSRNSLVNSWMLFQQTPEPRFREFYFLITLATACARERTCSFL